MSEEDTLSKRIRPISLNGKTVRVRTGHSSMYVTLSIDPEDDSKLFEIFAQVEKPDPENKMAYPQQCERAFMEAISRLVSTLLRYGIPAGEVIHQLEGIQCVPGSGAEEHGNWVEGVFISSPADGIAQVMKSFMEDAEKKDDE